MTIPGGYVALDTLTAANMNLLPAGKIAYAAATANQASVTSIVDLTGLTVTFTALASRKYRVSAQVYVGSTVTADVVALYITDGASTPVQVAQQLLTTSGAITVTSSVIVSSVAGSTTYKLRGQRTAGTGSLTFVAAAANPMYILVEDIGPA
jgi:hypothetical protein